MAADSSSGAIAQIASKLPWLADRLRPHLSLNDGGCWVVGLAPARRGYRQLKVNGRREMVHRAVYQATRGAIPAGLQLDHLCRNTACCNPDHLEPVTARINTLRGTSFAAVNAAKSFCKRGHPFDAQNTRANSRRPERICRACKAIRESERRARLRDFQLKGKANG